MDKSIYSADYRRLCAELKAARARANLRQVDVAERLGMPQSFVSKYESGERRLDVVEALHVAEALDTTLAAIIELVRNADPE